MVMTSWLVYNTVNSENKGNKLLKESKDQYQKRILYYRRRFEKLTQTTNRLSNLRLLTFLVGCGLAVFFYRYGKVSLCIASVLLTLLLFSVQVFWHQNLKKYLNYFRVLADNYDQALRRLAGEWPNFSDTGEDFLDPAHAYAEDLDILGSGSLFQWITTAKTFKGREALKSLLTRPPEDIETIIKRQETIRELAQNLAWRQRFLAEARMAKQPLNSPAKIIEWSKSYDASYLRLRVRILARALPVITISFLLIYLLTSKVSVVYPVIGIVLQSLILFLGKERGNALNAVYAYKESLRIYEKLLERLEKRTFRSEYLLKLQKGLRDRDGKPAFEQIRKLSGLADLIANRENVMFLIINILTLWDIQCMISLESWKEKSGRFLGNWLETVAELEALNSLAIIAADHPDWAVPVITADKTGISAHRIGHPLVNGAVCNDLSLEKDSGILLITGSNMSGKSTLLRTAGINLVLTYAGAPVFAQRFSCSIFRIYTCMRVSDNLGEKISSFYAELLRIKQIVSAAKTDSHIFFLLDEIFKGTNSQDRHDGAKLLIRQLSKAGAMGMVSTHDLELGDLEQESGRRIRNYHFREYYQDEEIQFDYKLRPGISTTRNAMYLIKMAGIEV